MHSPPMRAMALRAAEYRLVLVFWISTAVPAIHGDFHDRK